MVCSSLCCPRRRSLGRDAVLLGETAPIRFDPLTSTTPNKSMSTENLDGLPCAMQGGADQFARVMCNDVCSRRERQPYPRRLFTKVRVDVYQNDLRQRADVYRNDLR